MLRINKNFTTLQGASLIVFAERVLRNLQGNPYVLCPESLSTSLRSALEKLRDVIADPGLKRKMRTQAVRYYSAPVQSALLSIAVHIERTAQVKSDINTTGFRPAAEQRKKELAVSY